jgi:omega-amidase
MSTLTISIVQTQLYWEDPEKNLQMLQDKILAIKERTELVILPEMFSTGFSMRPEELAETMDGKAIAWMKDIAAQKKLILTGSIMVKEGDHYFNRLVWMLPNGQFGYYDKRHLFAYAGEHQHYCAGSRRLIASVKGWKINLLVCYDLRFPVWSRQSAPTADKDNGNEQRVPEYDMLVYVANWPERRNTAWKTLLRARAIENQCFVAGVNRVGNDGNNIYHSGDSMLIDPLGEILYTKEHDEDIFTYTLHKEALNEIRNKLPFLNDADRFHIEP